MRQREPAERVGGGVAGRTAGPAGAHARRQRTTGVAIEHGEGQRAAAAQRERGEAFAGELDHRRRQAGRTQLEPVGPVDDVADDETRRRGR
jgi:hypothetical protein